jgi:hypothetical protein
VTLTEKREKRMSTTEASRIRATISELEAIADTLERQARPDPAGCADPRDPARPPAPRPTGSYGPQRPAPRGDITLVKFGRDVGTPLADIDDASLRWYAGALQKSVDDPTKAKWREKNEADLAAARAEQDRRFVR